MFYRFDEDITGGLEAIRKTVSNIMDETKSIIGDEDLFFDLRLVLNELLINAYEHGNKGDKNKFLHICLVIDDIELKLRVQDEGEGLCLDSYGYDCSKLYDHGRGLLIVKKLTDCLQVEDNVVRCIFNRE
ncbi:MAG: ATP-binding protein [Tissierellia bacterium]|nr:ATP-binding protein [Tissierellia bacterium]